MLCFCIAVCFLVLKPLKEKYPEVTPKCIADDAHAPTVVYKPADIKRAAQWCNEYVALPTTVFSLAGSEFSVGPGCLACWFEQPATSSNESVKPRVLN